MTKVEPEDENENSEETTQEVSTEISDDTKDGDVARLLDATQKMVNRIFKIGKISQSLF